MKSGSAHCVKPFLFISALIIILFKFLLYNCVTLGLTAFLHQPWHPNEDGALPLRERSAGEAGQEALTPPQQHQHLQGQGRPGDGLQPRDCDRVTSDWRIDEIHLLRRILQLSYTTTLST